jgi:hypothetical protein
MTFKDYIGKEQLTAEEQKQLIDELNKTSVVIAWEKSLLQVKQLH